MTTRNIPESYKSADEFSNDMKIADKLELSISLHKLYQKPWGDIYIDAELSDILRALGKLPPSALEEFVNTLNDYASQFSWANKEEE